MAKPPLILVSPSIEKRGVEFHDLSVSLSVKYDFAVLEAGGIPVTVPTTTDRALLAECVRRVDGVLLTGGDDIEPDLYAPHLPPAVRKTVDTTPDGGGRDLRELMLIEEIFRQRKPVLAVCRGHQLLNVALTRGSLIANICQKRVLGVNSSHHQAVVEPAEPFVATARSSDGLVEAMELKTGEGTGIPFFLSVQFHPERLTRQHREHRAIFGKFVGACKQRVKQKSCPRPLARPNSKSASR
jgi:putative glutamine amidotransferase